MPSEVNARGCTVYRDDHALEELHKLSVTITGDMIGHGSRYPFDTNLKGWEQFDNPQDASYYGIWVSVDHKATFSYCEGDKTLVVAPTDAAFLAELIDLWEFSKCPLLHDAPRVQLILADHLPFVEAIVKWQEGKRLEASAGAWILALLAELEGGKVKVFRDSEGNYWDAYMGSMPHQKFNVIFGSRTQEVTCPRCLNHDKSISVWCGVNEANFVLGLTPVKGSE